MTSFSPQTGAAGSVDGRSWAQVSGRTHCDSGSSGSRRTYGDRQKHPATHCSVHGRGESSHDAGQALPAQDSDETAEFVGGDVPVGFRTEDHAGGSNEVRYLVRVTARTAGRVLPLDEVREAVVQEWGVVRRKELDDELYDRLRAKYAIVVERE